MGGDSESFEEVFCDLEKLGKHKNSHFRRQSIFHNKLINTHNPTEPYFLYNNIPKHLRIQRLVINKQYFLRWKSRFQ